MVKFVLGAVFICFLLFIQVNLLGWDNIPIGKEAKTCREEWELCVGPLCAVILLDLAIITVIHILYDVAQFNPD